LPRSNKNKPKLMRAQVADNWIRNGLNGYMLRDRFQASAAVFKVVSGLGLQACTNDPHHCALAD
jgi:hypothetical protein